MLSSLLDLYPPQAIASVDMHGMTPLHHSTIHLLTHGKTTSQECHDLLLTQSPSIVVHKAIEAGMDWNQLRPIIISKLHALTVEDENGLVPFMVAATSRCNPDNDDVVDDLILGQLTMTYELLCLMPHVMKAYDVSH